jgi:uncharacterized protein YkwD
MSRALPIVFALWGACALAAQPDPLRVSRLVAAGVNQAREKAERKPLLPDARLARAAQSFAEFLARTDRLDHDADGADPGQRMHGAGYAWCRYAENIAYEFDSRGFDGDALARALVTDWLDSAGHRRNLMDARMRDTGVGIAQSASTKRWYGVQVFGAPCATSAH